MNKRKKIVDGSFKIVLNLYLNMSDFVELEYECVDGEFFVVVVKLCSGMFVFVLVLVVCVFDVVI